MKNPLAMTIGVAQLVQNELSTASCAQLMGCISISSALCLNRLFEENRSSIKQIHVLELARTTSMLIKRFGLYHSRTMKGMSGVFPFTTTSDDLGNPKMDYVRELVKLDMFLGHRNLVFSDIVDHYMTEEQILNGLGPRLRLLGQCGLVLVRTLIEYSQPVNKEITSRPKENATTNHKRVKFWHLLKEAGFNVSMEEVNRQLDNMFPKSSPGSEKGRQVN